MQRMSGQTGNYKRFMLVIYETFEFEILVHVAMNGNCMHNVTLDWKACLSIRARIVHFHACQSYLNGYLFNYCVMCCS